MLCKQPRFSTHFSLRYPFTLMNTQLATTNSTVYPPSLHRDLKEDGLEKLELALDEDTE